MGSIRKQGDRRAVLRLPWGSLPGTNASGHGRQQEEDPEGPRSIEADIAAGTFDYRRYFPASKNAARFDAAPAVSVAVTVTAPSAPAAPPTPLFKDFAETWYLEKEVEWRKSHRITVRRELDSLISRFGEKAVGQITKADVLAYRAELGKVTARGKETKLSAARINKMLNPLRQILNEAADRFNFPTPCQNIKQLRIKRTDVDPFSLEDVRSILATVREDFRDYFTVRFFTGMRTGEVDGLKWKYVDFERRLILVRDGGPRRRGVHQDRRLSAGHPDEPARLRGPEAPAGGDRQGFGFVFCNRLGKPLDHKNVTNRVWYPSSVTWGSRSGGPTSAGTRRPPCGWPPARRRSGSRGSSATRPPRCCSGSIPATSPT
jgi:integrase